MGKNVRSMLILALLLCTVMASLLSPAPSEVAFASDIIVDNTDAGFSVISGIWATSTNLTGYYGSNYRTIAAGTGASVVKWTTSIATEGDYDVYTYYVEHPNRASNAKFTVYYDGGSQTVTVDQRSGSKWVLLGTFHFKPGASSYVQLSDNGNGYIIADAIKFTTSNGAVTAPSGLSAAMGEKTNINLSWTDNSTTEAGFSIEQSTDNTNWTSIGTVGSNITAYQSWGLYESITYYYRVRAFDASSFSGYSNVASLTTSASSGVSGTIIAPTSPTNARNGEGSILKLANGDLLYMYGEYGSSSGDLGAAKLVKRVSTDDGATWSSPVTVVGGSNTEIQAGLVQIDSHTVGLTYSHITSSTTADKYFTTSTDNGATWSSAINLTSDVSLPSYMTGALDRLTKLTVSGSTYSSRLIQQLHGKLSGGELATYVAYSDNGGATWSISSAIRVNSNPFAYGEFGFWEASIAELSTGELMIIGRTGMKQYYKAYSYDGGATWTTPVTTGIQVNQNPPTLKSIQGTNQIVLVWNADFSSSSILGSRKILASVYSDDFGVTWKNYRTLEYNGTDTFSYATLHFTSTTAYLTYYSPNGGAGAFLKKPLSWFTTTP